MEIVLTRGYTTVIDDADWKILQGYKWVALVGKNKKNNYAVSYYTDDAGKYRSILMHRLLLDAKRNQMVDHHDLDGLNNRRLNLRLCTQAKRSGNRRKNKNSKLPFKGIEYRAGLSKPWRARARCNGKRHNSEYFATAEEAHEAYKRLAKQLHGEFARP